MVNEILPGLAVFEFSNSQTHRSISEVVEDNGYFTLTDHFGAIIAFSDGVDISSVEGGVNAKTTELARWPGGSL